MRRGAPLWIRSRSDEELGAEAQRLADEALKLEREGASEEKAKALIETSELIQAEIERRRGCR